MKIALFGMTLISFFILTSSPSLAAKITNSSSSKKSKKNEVSRDTSRDNAQIKALMSSKSPFTIQMTGTFVGPPLNDLSSEYGPDPQGRKNNPVYIGGTVSGSYRISATDRTNFGTSILIMNPYAEQRRFDTGDPYASYSKLFRLGSFMQLHSSIGATAGLSEFAKSINQSSLVWMSHYLAYPVPNSRWSVGGSFVIDGSIYNAPAPQDQVVAWAYDTNLTLAPYAEYSLGQKITLKTTSTLSISHARNSDWGRWEDNLIKQTLGLGMSVTDKIYMYPYITFYPADLKTDTMALSAFAIISAF